MEECVLLAPSNDRPHHLPNQAGQIFRPAPASLSRHFLSGARRQMAPFSLSVDRREKLENFALGFANCDG
jgi:hypothetical protein